MTPQQRWAAKNPGWFRKYRAKNKAKLADYSRQWKRRNRRKVAKYARLSRARYLKVLQHHKLMHGCVDCGYRENAFALDLDHVRGWKKFPLSKGWRYGEATVKQELAKCDVVCANCHRIRTLTKKASA